MGNRQQHAAPARWPVPCWGRPAACWWGRHRAEQGRAIEHKLGFIQRGCCNHAAHLKNRLQHWGASVVGDCRADRRLCGRCPARACRCSSMVLYQFGCALCANPPESRTARVGCCSAIGSAEPGHALGAGCARRYSTAGSGPCAWARVSGAARGGVPLLRTACALHNPDGDSAQAACVRQADMLIELAAPW